MRQRVYERQAWFAGNEEIFDEMLYTGEARASGITCDERGNICIDALVQDQPLLCIGQLCAPDILASAQAIKEGLQAGASAVVYGRYLAHSPKGHPRRQEYLELHRIDIGAGSHYCAGWRQPLVTIKLPKIAPSYAQSPTPKDHRTRGKSIGVRSA